VHGAEAVVAAERITEAIFSNQIAKLTELDFKQLAQDGLPVSDYPSGPLALSDALFDSGLSVTPRGEVTRGQAKKLISGNAISVNGAKQTDTNYQLSREHALFGRYHLIQKGKKQHHLVVFNQ